jgi:hypothetical protein
MEKNAQADYSSLVAQLLAIVTGTDACIRNDQLTRVDLSGFEID